VRQHGGVAHKASDAAICVSKNDVKFTAATGNLPGHFTDSPKPSQLLPQARRDSTADVPHHDGLSRLDSKHVSRIDPHIGTTNDDRLYILAVPAGARA